MAIFGKFNKIVGQLPVEPDFAVAIAYAKQVLTPGTQEHARLMTVPVEKSIRVELGGGFFALEEAYFTKDAAEVRWEAHRKFVDLQLVVAGNERMEVADLSCLTLEEDLSPDRDVQFYRRMSGASRLRIGEGEAAVFFTGDAHRPGLSDGTPAVVRKAVVKIPCGVY